MLNLMDCTGDGLIRVGDLPSTAHFMLYQHVRVVRAWPEACF